MTEAFFSLALPIRNGLPGLKRAIEALQRQTYQNFELIVQDGGSTDASLDYVRQAALPRIDIVSEPDSGIAQAYGRALNRCAGPLVVALACDEWLDDDALETFASWYKEHPDAAYVYGGARLWKSETELHGVLYPGPYDLLKFLASEYKPTTGGFYNREIIGSDFHLDEGLKTCPDFDFFMRLGRRFDGRHIVEKRVVRFNAIIDRSSATYRAETYDQFAIDQHYILRRFFVQEGNCILNDYVRRYCTSGVSAHLAADLFDVGGETPRVHRFILEADRHNPASAAVIALVTRTRAFYYDAVNGRVRKRDVVQPELMPRLAGQMLGVIELSAVDTPAGWESGGAVTAHDVQGLIVTTCREPWGYSAQVPLNFNDDWIHGGWYWVRLSVRVEAGQVGIAIMMPGGMLKAERLISAGSAPVNLSLPFLRTDAAVLIRNGATPGKSAVRLLDATVYGMKMPDDRLTI